MSNETQLDRATAERSELRKFGCLFAVILLLLFDGLPWLKQDVAPLWPLYIALPCMLLTVVRPLALRWLYRGWLRFGETTAFINTRIIMGIVFFVLLTPLAWLLRLRGRDPLARHFEPKADSYRSASAAPDSKHMEKPY